MFSEPVLAIFIQNSDIFICQTFLEEQHGARRGKTLFVTIQITSKQRCEEMLNSRSTETFVFNEDNMFQHTSKLTFHRTFHKTYIQKSFLEQMKHEGIILKNVYLYFT